MVITNIIAETKTMVPSLWRDNERDPKNETIRGTILKSPPFSKCPFQVHLPGQMIPLPLILPAEEKCRNPDFSLECGQVNALLI